MSEIQPSQNRSFLENILFSPDENRLRAGWRLLLQTLFLILVATCFSILFTIILLIADPSLLTRLTVLGPGYLLLSSIAEAVLVTLSIFLARRFLDKRSIESLGLKLSIWTFYDILTGIVISFLQMGLIYFIMFQLGWITFKGFAWNFDPIPVVIQNTLLFSAMFVFVAWTEELLSRGYHLQTIASGTNLFWGVTISSVVFGALHLWNPNATWVSSLGILFAGLFFAFGYLRSKQLWLPMGMHLGWNFFEGVVFGFPVSGLDIYPLTRIEVHGPELWTGAGFGPEAGLIVAPALFLGALFVYLYTLHRTE